MLPTLLASRSASRWSPLLTSPGLRARHGLGREASTRVLHISLRTIGSLDRAAWTRPRQTAADPGNRLPFPKADRQRRHTSSRPPSRSPASVSTRLSTDRPIRGRLKPPRPHVPRAGDQVRASRLSHRRGRQLAMTPGWNIPVDRISSQSRPRGPGLPLPRPRRDSIEADPSRRTRTVGGRGRPDTPNLWMTLRLGHDRQP